LSEICIIGAGPAGLMAAICAAAENAPTRLIEANAVAGRKLLLTGGGRCNLTHLGTPAELARAFGRTGRFLRHSLHELAPEDVRQFFHARRVASVVEPDGCVFPESNRAVDVRDVLVEEAKRQGADLLYESPVRSISAEADTFVVETRAQRIVAARVILATGGISWPQTGSTGDGYRFAAQLGHTIVPPKPALVPLITRETWPGELAGIPVPDVSIRTTLSGRRISADGHMLFTQRGIGGPAVLDLSRLLSDDLARGSHVSICIDLLPSVDENRLDRQLRQQLQDQPKRTVANVLSKLLPRQLSQVLCRLVGCEEGLQAGQLLAAKRRRLVATIKKLPLCIVATEPIAKATVTRGGVSREEINPRTMESGIRPGLFLAGEMIDLDGPCGGYNLQMCWSTGALAGRSAARSCRGGSPPSK